MDRNRRLFAFIACLSAQTWGCAEWRGMPDAISSANVPDVHPLRKEREGELVRSFDRNRNAAQFAAAQTCWRQGDYDQAAEMLQSIIHRDPKHRDAQFLLADVHLERDRPAEAIAVMRSAVEHLPDDAEAAYRLGLALDGPPRGWTSSRVRARLG